MPTSKSLPICPSFVPNCPPSAILSISHTPYTLNSYQSLSHLRGSHCRILPNRRTIIVVKGSTGTAGDGHSTRMRKHLINTFSPSASSASPPASSASPTSKNAPCSQGISTGLLLKIRGLRVSFFMSSLAYSQKSKQIFVVPSTSSPIEMGTPSKVRSHSSANNKAFPLKTQINLIFTVKPLYIPNICCTFARKFQRI